MTNRQWLESLSDKEFVLTMCYSCKCCVGHDDNRKCGKISCRDGRIEWLKQEHKQEERREKENDKS